MHLRRLAVSFVVVPLLVVGCGGGDDTDDADASDDTSAATEAPATAPPVTEPTPTDPAPTEPPVTEPSTEPPSTEPASSVAPPATDAGGGEAPATIDVTLDEWFVEAPTDLAAGQTDFAILNDGSFPHELVVIEADGYASLPTAANGAVLEDELPDGAVIGRTDRMQGGATGALTVDLEPGTYVLLCNIVAGPTSHAGQGQTLDITVS